jgi:hypothetical protein
MAVMSTQSIIPNDRVVKISLRIFVLHLKQLFRNVWHRQRFRFSADAQPINLSGVNRAR